MFDQYVGFLLLRIPTLLVFQDKNRMAEARKTYSRAQELMELYEIEKRWFEIQKMVFWIGVGVLIGGAVLSIYGFITVQSLFEELRELSIPHYPLMPGPSPFPHLEARLFFVQVLQLVGLLMAVLGSVMLAYGLWVKKENK